MKWEEDVGRDNHCHTISNQVNSMGYWPFDLPECDRPNFVQPTAATEKLSRPGGS